MPHITAIEFSESQRRQLSEKLKSLSSKGWPLSGRYEAQDFGTWEKLFENLITPGLFAQRETVVIENSETLGAFPESLSNLIEDDNADCNLILIFNGDSKTLNTVKNSITLIKPEAQIPPWKRQEWLMKLARENKFSLSPDAAQLLSESIESQEELRGEIQKFALYSEGREIKIDDVENLSFDEGGRALLIFLDGVCNNKINDVARALKYLRDEPVLTVLVALTNRLRPALIMSCFDIDYSDMALKAVGFDSAKKNYAIKQSQNALKNFGAEKIKTFMAKSIRLSFLEKTNRAEGWQGFELILWEMLT